MTTVMQATAFSRACPTHLPRRPPAGLRCTCQIREPTGRSHEPQLSRRAALACLSAVCVLQTADATHAFGIDTLQSIFPDRDPKAAAGAVGSVSRKKLQDAEDAFQSSDLLKKLKEQTSTNSKRNKIDLQNKYCYRQAEMGIGDCGGLQLIPGMTKSGKQKTPNWLNKVLGVKEEDIPKDVSRPLGFPDINGNPTQ